MQPSVQKGLTQLGYGPSSSHLDPCRYVRTSVHRLLGTVLADEVRSSDYGAGKVKLELLYLRKQEKLTVMVRHVKDLVSNMLS